jgi:hypothetical protein
METTHGRILNERDVEEGRVLLVYWGAEEKPKLSVVVECDESFFIEAEDDERTVEEYHHALGTPTERRVPIMLLRGTYA